MENDQATLDLSMVERIVAVDLSPRDTLVVLCSHAVSIETAERLMKHFQNEFKHDKVVVLTEGLDVKVVRDA